MSSSRFEQQRHKPVTPLERERQLVIVCPSLRSRVNLSRIVRVAGGMGVRRIVAARPFTIDPLVVRSATETVHIESRGALPPVLRKLKADGYRLVGLEQTSGSTSLFEFVFPERTALVLGHERGGIAAEELGLLDSVVEIPVFGRPPSYNVASAATMAIYEYCRQHSARPPIQARSASE